MNLRFQTNTENIDFNQVRTILQIVKMSFYDEEMQRKAFENSFSVIFVFDDNNLIGFGRTLSDGVFQASVYDVAIYPDYQGFGIGKIIMKKLLETVKGCNVILYASIGKEIFYEKLNFRKMKTGMALFNNAENMKIKGFTE
jgi:ribosomal protein S18 acetylase RimI-like enzyme